MEKFERLFRLYKINYYIVDKLEKKIIQSNECSFIHFRVMFFKDECPYTDDIEYLLSTIYKNIKEHQNKKLIKNI